MRWMFELLGGLEAIASPCETQQCILFRPPLVGYVPGDMEWGGDDAPPGPGAGFLSCVDGCLRTVWVWGCVPSIPVGYNCRGPTHQDQGPSSCRMRAFYSRSCSPLFWRAQCGDRTGKGHGWLSTVTTWGQWP